MTKARPTVTLLCNGAKLRGKKRAVGADTLRLDYQGANARVRLRLPDFVRNVLHLPDRVLDLLEIAAYIFAADRCVGRGEKDALEYHAWSRSLRLVVRVRDHRFWARAAVQEKLRAALEFMSGDRRYEFKFEPGHRTPATGLFDREGFAITPEPDTRIVLFSGGLDSLAGVVEAMSDTGSRLCLMSHQSGQSGTVRTQNQLFAALEARYARRLRHYRFACGLRGEKADEETQRTRPFLYASMGFALAHALGVGGMTAYENGITAISFMRRGHLINARASRTTHPKTMWLMQEFLSEVRGEPFDIATPFLWRTKADVVKGIAEGGAADLISSAVSCSRTYQRVGPASQCGGCSQCVERRFAAHAAGLQEFDHRGLYSMDFLTEAVGDDCARTTLVDFVRQASHFDSWNIDHFQERLLAELTDVVGHVGLDEQETVEHVYGLCRRHGEQVAAAVRRMREAYDHPLRPVPPGSFLQMIRGGEYLGDGRDYHGLRTMFDTLVPGHTDAHAYERAVCSALEAIFEPELTNPVPQQSVDNGRMRIDIVFDNDARQGFFASLRDAHRKRCPWVLFECKNYSGKLENTEFAQLVDRMTRVGTEVGFIVCRNLHDPTEALEHCQNRSATADGKPILIVLDDADVKHLLDLRARSDINAINSYMGNKVRRVLFRTPHGRHAP